MLSAENAYLSRRIRRHRIWKQFKTRHKKFQMDYYYELIMVKLNLYSSNFLKF